MRASDIRVEELDVTTSRGVLSALQADAPRGARGVLLALHGGGSRAAYWDSPVDAAGSLLRRGAERGWRVLVPDRPGYGASVSWAPSGLAAREQAEVLAELVAPSVIGDLPVVVVAHSLGTLVAFELAAGTLVPGLRGLSVGGVPIEFTPAQSRLLAEVDTSGERVHSVAGTVLRDPADWFGPVGTWDPELLRLRDRLVTTTPTREFTDLAAFTADPGRLLARVDVAVQAVAGEHEMTTHDAATVLARLRSELVNVPTREFVLLDGSGHNLSLSYQNARYHNLVLGFAARTTRQDCGVARDHGSAAL